MRIANLNGRLVVTGEPGQEIAHDVEQNSSRRFAADQQAVYDQWAAFTAWAATAEWDAGVIFTRESLGAPAPRSGQVSAACSPPNNQQPYAWAIRRSGWMATTSRWPRYTARPCSAAMTRSRPSSEYRAMVVIGR